MTIWHPFLANLFSVGFGFWSAALRAARFKAAVPAALRKAHRFSGPLNRSVLAWFAVVSGGGAATPPTDLIYGHYEIHVDYTATPGDPDAGWRFSVSYDEDDDFSTANGVVRLDPAAVTFVAGPVTEAAVPQPPGVFGRFGAAGAPLWVLPQNNALGALFLGVRTTMSPGIFQARVGNHYTPSGQGSISLRLVSVEGTGPEAGGQFATWKTESFGTVVFSFDTTDGIGAADEIPTVPVRSHTHYNWGLTRPGIYRVTLEAMGKLISPNAFTSARETFTFAVPFSGRVGAGGELRLTDGGGLIAADPGNGVAYAPDQAMVEAVPVEAGWEWSGEVSAAALNLPNGVGVSPAAASAGLPAEEWSEVQVRLAAIYGPGDFALVDEEGGVLGEVFEVEAGSARPIRALFSERGIYRATFAVTGMRAGVPVAMTPVTLSFGAGVGADFDYTAWRESFERSAELADGALADPDADYDRDGVPNGVEFAFFWQGMDPAVADGWRMPRAFPTPEGHGAVEFLRDTWKDRLNETGWDIHAEASPDLVTWQVRSSRVPGFPLELFETGAERGNAYGRILRRQLRAIGPGEGRHFFRFRVGTP